MDKKFFGMPILVLGLLVCFLVMCNPFVKFSKAGDVKFYSPNEIVSLFEKNGFVKNGIEINGKVQIIKLQRK